MIRIVNNVYEGIYILNNKIVYIIGENGKNLVFNSSGEYIGNDIPAGCFPIQDFEVLKDIRKKVIKTLKDYICKMVLSIGEVKTITKPIIVNKFKIDSTSIRFYNLFLKIETISDEDIGI